MELIVAYDIGDLEFAAAINAANIHDGGSIVQCFGGWHIVHGSVIDVA